MTSMRPWDISTINGKPVSDDFIIPLWKDFSTADFLFSLREDAKSIIVFITPMEYYNKFHFMYGDSMPIINLIPDDFEEISPGCYEVFNFSLTEIKEYLLQKGFIHSSMFQTFTNTAQNLNYDLEDI
jgi:hypothetical protein